MTRGKILCHRVSLLGIFRSGCLYIIGILENEKKRILQQIAKAGKKGLTCNELTRKTQFIRRNRREEYLEDLLEGKQIVKRINDDAHAHSEIYILNDIVA